MILLASLTFLTPLGGIVAVAVAAPAIASLWAAAHNARGRAVLGLTAAPARRWQLAAIVLVPLLLGLAAARPALRSHVGRRVRTDAQAIFIFDTSRSMAASAGVHAPTRFAQAQAAAIRLRAEAIPELPAGVSSLTTEMLPHLFPTPDVEAFNSVVRNALGVEKPPPPFLLYGVRGTSFGALSLLRTQGYFDPKTTHRFAILLTDGESGAIDAPSIGKALTLSTGYPPPPAIQTPGLPARVPQAPVSLFIIRVGTGSDRVFDANGKIEAAYRPDPTARQLVGSLAAAAHGRVFTSSQLAAAVDALRKAAGSGSGRLEGTTVRDRNLAPYLVVLALLPLAALIVVRNLRKA